MPDIEGTVEKCCIRDVEGGREDGLRICKHCRSLWHGVGWFSFLGMYVLQSRLLWQQRMRQTFQDIW